MNGSGRSSLGVEGFEGIARFAGGGSAAIARIPAETFEEAASQILSRAGGAGEVKSIEITDLRFEERSE